MVTFIALRREGDARMIPIEAVEASAIKIPFTIAAGQLENARGEDLTEMRDDIEHELRRRRLAGYKGEA